VAHSPGCCVRKQALSARATPSKSPSFMAIFLIILILPAPSLCPGKVPLLTLVKTTSVAVIYTILDIMIYATPGTLHILQ